MNIVQRTIWKINFRSSSLDIANKNKTKKQPFVVIDRNTGSESYGLRFINWSDRSSKKERERTKHFLSNRKCREKIALSLGLTEGLFFLANTAHSSILSPLAKCNIMILYYYALWQPFLLGCRNVNVLPLIHGQKYTLSQFHPG